jgi:hypothetical protein
MRVARKGKRRPQPRNSAPRAGQRFDMPESCPDRSFQDRRKGAFRRGFGPRCRSAPWRAP